MRKFATEGALLAVFFIFLVTAWLIIGLLGDQLPVLGIHRISLPGFYDEPSNVFPSFTSAPPVISRILAFVWLAIVVLATSVVLNRNWVPSSIASVFCFGLSIFLLLTISASNGFLYGQFFPISIGLILLFSAGAFAAFSLVEIVRKLKNVE